MTVTRRVQLQEAVHVPGLGIKTESKQSGAPLVQLINCRLLSRNGQLVDSDLWFQNGKILNAFSVFFQNRAIADVQIDCNGAIISPGLIDVQLNGGFGVDFSTFGDDVTDADYARGLNTVARGVVKHGVTSFLPTLITSSPAVYKKSLPVIGQAIKGTSIDAAHILGAHLEGPFLSSQKCGCHPPEFLHHKGFGSDVTQTLSEVYGPDLSPIRVVTLAAELDGAEEAVRVLKQKGICVSLGHSSAQHADGVRAVQAGANSITHLFNAMNSYHHRDPGLVGLLATPSLPHPVYYGLIADGIHTHDSALRIAHRTAPDSLVLVTDAMGALGMGDGRHRLGAQTIIVRGLHATLEGTDITAGSVATMDQCVRHFVQATSLTLGQALVAATLRPATLLELHHQKGVLENGADADLALWDQDGHVQATFVQGRLAYVAAQHQH